MVIHTLMKMNFVIYFIANVYKAFPVFSHHTLNLIFITLLE